MLPWAPPGAAHILSSFRTLGKFLPNDSRQVEAPSCTRCPLVDIGGGCFATFLTPPTGPGFPFGDSSPQDHCLLTFPCGLLSISVPSVYPIDFAPPYLPLLHPFPPSLQLHHQPVIGFCKDPYTCTSSPGEGVPLTYNPHLGPRQQGGSGGEPAISQLLGPPGTTSLLLPSFGTTSALLLLCPRSWLHILQGADTVK